MMQKWWLVMKINRLDLLKQEKEKMMHMKTLSFALIRQCCDYYQHEIDCIEQYGSENPEYEIEEGEW